jgi:phosphoglycolate phosphatase
VRVGLVVFDLDGTLVDSKRDLADAANALIVERGGAPLAEDAIAAMVGEGAGLLVRRALTAARLDPAPSGALERFLALYDERLLNHTVLYDGMRDALAALAPRLPLAVLTNKPAPATERILEGLAIRGFFRDVIGGDTPLGRKPDAAGLRELIARAGVTPDATLMVGDSRIDLETARSAGTRICLARYGFGYRFEPGDFRGDELFIDTPGSLLSVL